jgi:hypothetical protein
MKNRRRVRLFVEELESRLVPTAYSTNWSGYAVTGSAVTDVKGSWVVPTVTLPSGGTNSGSYYSSNWIGIDGYSSNSVEQIGTEQDFIGGKARYSAWYEMYPANSVNFSNTVKPGDMMSAEVANNNGTFTLTLTDTNPVTKVQNWTQTITKTSTSAAASSAEWIVEAPTLVYFGRFLVQSTLPNFGTTTFTQAQATIGGSSGSISSFGSNVQQIDMVNSKGTLLLDSTSGLTGDTTTSSFSVTWLTSGLSKTSTSKTSGSSIKGVMVQDIGPAPVTTTNFIISGALATPPPGINVGPFAQAPLDSLTRGIPELPTTVNPAITAFFAGSGGMDAPGNLWAAGIGSGAVGTSSDTDVQWFTPSPGSGALAPPAVVPASETPDTAPGFSLAPSESAAKPYLAGVKWNSDPGSTREQTPIYGSDVPVSQSAAGVVLLGAVLSDRRRREEEAE